MNEALHSLGSRNFLTKFITSTLLLCTIAITPWWSLDPINLVKLLVISTTGTACFFILILNWRYVYHNTSKVLFYTCLIFLFDLIIASTFGSMSFSLNFFGVTGRNTGLLAYSSLLSLLLLSSLISTPLTINKFGNVLFLAGVISAIYGGFQAVGLDPIDWVNPYSPVVGFLGNPDFQSAFLGIAASVCMARTLDSLRKTTQRIFYALVVLLFASVIYTTDAQQGLILLFVNLLVFLFLILVKKRRRYLTFSYTLLVGFLSLIMLAGSLDKGPLATLLHKASVIYRGDYWHAAWSMLLSNPIVGVGLDGYGDWYRRTRTIQATLRRGPEVASNASHNVVLDFASNGGFPLLLLYLLLVGLVLNSIFRIIRRPDEKNFEIYALIVAWIGFQIQSIISINQIGLAVWGWVFSGLIIGYDRVKARQIDSEEISDKFTKMKKKYGAKDISQPGYLPAAMVLSLFVGSLCGVVVGAIPLKASVEYRNALESGEIEDIKAAAYIRPLTPERMVQIAQTLHDNNFDKEALATATDATRYFPDYFQAWYVLSKAKLATPSQVDLAKKQLIRLDPNNPDLK